MKRWTPIALAVGLVALSSEGMARAESRECTAAAETGQVLRNSGKLVQAKERLLVCMKSCPAVVQNDCGQWLHEIEQRLPSIVVRATDPSGKEVTDVRVVVDGAPLASRLDGIAVPIDPGLRKMTFEREGFAPVSEDLTIREGEKARPVVVRFKELARAKTTPARADERGIPTTTFVLGGVGLVGLGMFTVYHLSAKSDLDAMRETCAPRCAADEADKVETKIAVSNVALGVGIAALAGAALVWILEGRSTSASAKVGASPSFDPRAPLRLRF
ncbi:MAG: hypothetical protein JST00_37670 [Deltaproteobacteria bacterium]|nr:hypothetical protein [Deltaproteobacteria bacterium]